MWKAGTGHTGITKLRKEAKLQKEAKLRKEAKLQKGAKRTQNGVKGSKKEPSLT